ncbi:hypothetical protein [Cupriavidus basilensis]|uniref:hypothetical protein n=1 Tax=Cupriavidus basilensis TaxID=68895 RepID=UPI000750CEF7|nr:hypothetical protein [Cupriavidus basilensis]
MENLYVELRFESQLFSMLKMLAKSEQGSEFIQFDPPVDDGEPTLAMLQCKSANLAEGAFLRLVPFQEEIDLRQIPAALLVPVHLVAWMAETNVERPRFLGFVA